jgi:hypothetical protein
MYKKVKIDSSQEQKVLDTIKQSGSEGKIVGAIMTTGKIPRGYE